MKVGDQEGQPLGARILVRPDERREKKSQGGIIIPESAQEKPPMGIIVAVGPKAENVSEGDRVLFGKYAGSEVSIGGEGLLIMQEDDILMTLRPVRTSEPVS